MNYVIQKLIIHLKKSRRNDHVVHICLHEYESKNPIHQSLIGDTNIFKVKRFLLLHFSFSFFFSNNQLCINQNSIGQENKQKLNWPIHENKQAFFVVLG